VFNFEAASVQYLSLHILSPARALIDENDNPRMDEMPFLQDGAGDPFVCEGGFVL
jgi:hypothetical protein